MNAPGVLGIERALRENAQEDPCPSESEGCPGMPAGGEKDGPGWLHQRAQKGSGEEQLVSVVSDFSRPCACS